MPDQVLQAEPLRCADQPEEAEEAGAAIVPPLCFATGHTDDVGVRHDRVLPGHAPGDVEAGQHASLSVSGLERGWQGEWAVLPSPGRLSTLPPVGVVVVVVVVVVVAYMPRPAWGAGAPLRARWAGAPCRRARAGAAPVPGEGGGMIGRPVRIHPHAPALRERHVVRRASGPVRASVVGPQLVADGVPPVCARRRRCGGGCGQWMTLTNSTG